MSEPNSGSDLASVQTKATQTDGGWLVNGAKLWSSGIHRSDYMIALVRTAPPGDDRHAGLSQFIIDLKVREGLTLTEPSSRLLAATIDRGDYEAAEAGEIPERLWAAIAELGFAGALVPEDQGWVGLSPAQGFEIIRVLGRFTAPVPLAETILAAHLLALAGLSVPDGALSLAPARAGSTLTRVPDGEDWRLSGDLVGVPWGRAAKAVVAAVDTEAGPKICLIEAEQGEARAGRTIGGEALDSLSFDHARLPAAHVAGRTNLVSGPEAIQVHRAMMRAAQIAGAGEAVMDIAVGYLTRRLWSWRQEFGNETYWQARLGAQIAKAGAEALWPALAGA